MLRVGNNYYFYKNRDLTGIPMFDWSCIANDRIFLFLDLYVILRDQPDKVYYMDGERRGSDQWYLKLIDIANPNIKNFKEVPSSWLPKRQCVEQVATLRQQRAVGGDNGSEPLPACHQDELRQQRV